MQNDKVNQNQDEQTPAEKLKQSIAQTTAARCVDWKTEEQKGMQSARTQAMAASLADELFDESDELEAVEFYSRMFAIYGSKWASTYGRSIYNGEGLTEDAKIWLRYLSKMTLEQLKRGFSRVQKLCALEIEKTYQAPWPVTPAEFFGLGCDEKIAQAMNPERLRKIGFLPPKVERTAETAEQAKAAIDEIKAILRGVN